MTNNHNVQFFLGSNTKKGFVPLFDQLRDEKNFNHFYILKGGPGSGKSSLMRRIATALEHEGHNIEFIHCASDPHSLDAIIDYDAKFSMVDGTSPHTMDPNYPGVYDSIINLGDLWNQNELKHHKTEIIDLSDRIGQCHSMATASIKAAASLMDANRKLAAKHLDHDAITTKVSNLALELADLPKGRERKRLLSAVSVDSFAFFEYTVFNLCKKIYNISDDWGASSHAFMNQLRDIALSKSIGFISCYCSIQIPDKIDHLLFPEAGIAIVTSNPFHSINGQGHIPIEGLTKPIDLEDISSMTKNLSIAQTLIDHAGNHIGRAKRLHDDLEGYYVAAMDFSGMDAIYEKIMAEILEFSKTKNKLQMLLD